MNSTLEILKKIDRPFYHSKKIYLSVRPIKFDGIDGVYDIGWELCIVDEDDGYVGSCGAAVYSTRKEAIEELERRAKKNRWKKVR